MKIRTYLNGVLPIIISFIAAMVISNIALASNSLEAWHLADSLYINGLCVGIFAGGITIHYLKLAKAYKKAEQWAKNQENIEDMPMEESELPGSMLLQQLMIDHMESTEKIKESYKEKMQDMSEYTTQVVHDIKVNLGVCELVTQRLSGEDNEKLKYEIQQMKFRVNQLLYATRANNYDQDISISYFQIEKVLKDAIKENAEFFMCKDIELEVDLKPYELLTDQKWIFYILAQILNNSSKYTGIGGKVSIASREDDKAYYVEIKDNGIGIAQEELTRIFDKGYTGSNGRLNTKSTGMGLYYAKQMAGILNMGLEAESVQGEYTKFTLAFYKHSDYIHQQEK